MSSQRDPFPMNSAEANRLASSVNKDESITWNKMSTTTTESSTSHNNTTSTSIDTKGLIKGTRRSKLTSNSENIYETMDDQDPNSKYDNDDDDDEIDRPTPYFSSNSNPIFKFFQSCFLSLHRQIYGSKLPPSEMLRTLCLASTLFFMIGGYWLMRSLKDPVLTALCGVTAIPKAKMLSVFVVLGVVSIYNRLLDNPNLSKHTLFYIFGMFYFMLFIVISMFLKHPTIGLPNQTPSYGRVLGWISYCSIESFGSVMVSLFWSFANSNFSLESAKASYGLLVATAQVGSILGPTFVQLYANDWGVANMYMVGAFVMLLLQGTMYLYIQIYGTDEIRAKEAAIAAGGVEKQKKKSKAGVLEGLHLFVKHNYVKGIFAISCLFMVEVTIVDYTMKVLARDHFANLHPCVRGNSCWDYTTDQPSGMSQEATAAFTTFMGFFGQATNALSFFLSFFGTSAVIRTLGLRLTLLLFPTLCLITIIIVRLNPTLYVVFAAMMVLKANSYALNNPTKEMLYQPTSSAVKYKAKSWIDIFGARGSKALGSLVTNAFSDSATNLIQNGSLVGMCVASFLIWNARFMGRTFDKYIASGYIVGGEDEEVVTDNDLEAVEMAEKQNDTRDTSCAIYEDDDEIEDVSDHNDATGEGENKADVQLV